MLKYNWFLYSQEVTDLKIAVIVLQVIFSLGLILTILLQSGKSAGLSGAITGGAESIFGKKKGMDDLLNKVSTGFATGFIISSLVLAYLMEK